MTDPTKAQANLFYLDAFDPKENFPASVLEMYAKLGSMLKCRSQLYESKFKAVELSGVNAKKSFFFPSTVRKCD